MEEGAQERIWLDGQHRALRTREVACGYGEFADVSSNVVNDLSRSDEAANELQQLAVEGGSAGPEITQPRVWRRPNDTCAEFPRQSPAKPQISCVMFDDIADAHRPSLTGVFSFPALGFAVLGDDLSIRRSYIFASMIRRYQKPCRK